jgi:hypothetical protein
MARTAKSAPVTAKMYRHFAVATVVITAALAFFADGNTQQALEQELARQPAKPAATPPAKKAFTFKDGRKSQGWGSDSNDNGIGVAPDTVGVQVNDAYSPAGAGSPGGPPPFAAAVPLRGAELLPMPDKPPPGMSEGAWRSLREAQEAQKKRKRRGKQPPPKAPPMHTDISSSAPLDGEYGGDADESSDP